MRVLPARNPEADKQARGLFIAALCALLIHGLYATVTQRGLYGDASWFLLRIMSEDKVTSFYSNFSREFYYSRFVAYHLTQLPTVIAQSLGVSEPRQLSWILNATYFCHKPLSLIACYLVLPPSKKLLVIFPILGIFAGSMVSEVYIVTETHLAASFFWPVIIAICFCRSLEQSQFALLATAILISSFIYESFAFLGMFWLGCALLRAYDSEAGGKRTSWLFISLLCIAPILVNWAAILMPRDPTNKSAFTGGLLRLITDTRTGIPNLHVAAVVAMSCIASLLPLMLSSRANNARATFFFALAVAFALTAFPVIHFAMNWKSVDFTQAITDRVVGGLALQLAIAVLFSVTVLSPKWLEASARSVVPIILGLILGQTCYQILNTAVWSDSVTRLRETLASRSGLLYCDGSSTPFSVPRKQLADRTLCRWWVLPLGAVLSEQGTVQTLVRSLNEPFLPFDPTSPQGLPEAHGNVDYSPYAAALRTDNPSEKATAP